MHAGSVSEVRLNAYPSDVFIGTVENIGKYIDSSARTVVARILIQDHNNLLKAGLFGSARVKFDTNDTSLKNKHLVVPLSAVTELAGQSVVFVQQADSDFDVHPVTLGQSSEGFVEILTGLREDESVVVEGVFTLKSAVLKSTFAEE